MVKCDMQGGGRTDSLQVHMRASAILRTRIALTLPRSKLQTLDVGVEEAAGQIHLS